MCSYICLILATLLSNATPELPKLNNNNKKNYPYLIMILIYTSF